MMDSPDKGEQLKAIMSGIDEGFRVLGKNLLKDQATRSVHATEILETPVIDAFGTFTKKWDYVDGCELGSQLVHGPVGEIAIVAKDTDGSKTAFIMGRTPDVYSTSKGGKVISNAGNEGDFLCVVQKIDGLGKLVGPQSFQYLDTEDLTQNVVRKNSTPIEFRNRKIQMVGPVERIYGLLDK